MRSAQNLKFLVAENCLLVLLQQSLVLTNLDRKEYQARHDAEVRKQGEPFVQFVEIHNLISLHGRSSQPALIPERRTGSLTISVAETGRKPSAICFQLQ